MAPLDLSSKHLEEYKQKALADLHSAASTLNHRASILHTRFVEPTVNTLSRSARQQPVLATFLGVFAFYAFFPVLTFLLFTSGTIFVVGGGALLASAVVIAWLVSIAGLLLLGTLAVVAFMTITTALSLGATYALYRFWSILKQADTLPDAIQDFRDEAVALLVPGSLRDGDAQSKVRFAGVVKAETGENASLNDLKSGTATHGTS